MIRTLLIVVAQELVKLALGSAFGKKLDRIFSRLDQQMALLLSRGSSRIDVAHVVDAAISSVTGKPATAQEKTLVRLLFDPSRFLQRFNSSR